MADPISRQGRARSPSAANGHETPDVGCCGQPRRYTCVSAPAAPPLTTAPILNILGCRPSLIWLFHPVLGVRLRQALGHFTLTGNRIPSLCRS
jgi:hypothetical protein